MAFIDYYQVLGVGRDASVDDIKKAYRKLARQHHPDLNPDNKEAHQRFQQINEANEVLSDPEKRKQYDAYGEHWQHAGQFEQARNRPGSGGAAQGNPFEGSWSSADYSGNFDEGQFSDFFESMFGSRAGGGRQSRFRGQDYHAEVHLSLREAATTHQRTFTVNGKNIRITLHAGVADGQQIKLGGQGGPGTNGGPQGDLYLTLLVDEDPLYRREDDNLYLTAEIDLYTALLGGETTIETLTGKVRVPVKSETQPDTRIRLRGKGFPVYRQEGQFGDLYVTLSVRLPTQLTDEQKDLIRQVAALSKA